MKNSNLGPRLTEEILRREWAEEKLCALLTWIRPQDVTDPQARVVLQEALAAVVERGLYLPPTEKERKMHGQV